jgi:hypothetical protein
VAYVLAGALIASCSGGGNRLLPSAGGFAPNAASESSLSTSRRHKIPVRLRIRIPRRTRDHVRIAHPSTISALTQSVGISVDGGTQVNFNTTPTSPGCVAGATGLVCTFNLAAPVGNDTFKATTYSNPGSNGIALDQGTATVPITAGQANSVVVSLGPVVTNTNNSGVGSLRYAVATSNPGDTIIFLLPTPATIGLTGPISIAGKTTIAGPGVSGGITISGGGANQLFIVNGTLTISGLILTAGKAATPSFPGGAIYNAGTLTLAANSIGNSTSIVSIRRARFKQPGALRPHCVLMQSEGGAVYNNGTLVSSGNTFNGNTISNGPCITGDGGAIFNDAAGSISSTNDTFSNNAAQNGGAVFNVGLSPASFTSDTFTGNTGCTATLGCAPTGCTNTGCTNFEQGIGGAIYDSGLGAVITSSTFTNNVAGGASNGSHGIGGAIVFGGGIPVVTGSTFSGNVAGGGSDYCSIGQGGAIYDNGLTLELDNDTFTNNQATGDATSGGGAVVGAQAISGSGDTFTSNAAVGKGSSTCTAAASSSGIGGAIYDSASALITLTKSTFTGNSASGNQTGGGGAIAAMDAILAGDTFTSNTAVGTGAQGASANGLGGAVYTSSVAKVTGSTFTSNGATAGGATPSSAGGGAIYDNGTLVSSGNTFTSNAISLSPGSGLAVGGAVVDSGTTISTGDAFKSNTATSSGGAGGGAAYLAGSYLINSGTFTGNSTTGVESLGGAIGASAAGKITNTTITGNAAHGGSAIGAGGGIYDTGGFEMSNSVVSQNTVAQIGGGIASSGSETISGSSITGNTVTNAALTNMGGGGVFGSAGLAFNGSTIANNTVTISGAGASGGGGILGASMLLESSTVSGNALNGSAPNSGGGGIAIAGNFAAINSTITGNVSHDDGGGLWLPANFTVTLINDTIYQNTASGNGGNFDNLGTSTTIINSILAGGSAPTGPDINNPGAITSGDYNLIQTAVAGNALGGSTGNDLSGDPKLLPLANNGGLTFTNADQAQGVSPGTGHIPYTGGTHCGGFTLANDQRGYARGAGGVCDVGAFEFAGIPTASRPRPLPPLHNVKRGRSLVKLPVLHVPVITLPRIQGV